jgi:hypothetical protein
MPHKLSAVADRSGDKTKWSVIRSAVPLTAHLSRWASLATKVRSRHSGLVAEQNAFAGRATKRYPLRKLATASFGTTVRPARALTCGVPFPLGTSHLYENGS